MGKAPVGTAIIRLALPMAAAMLAQAVYNMTDMYFIGQTKDPDMVAAVSLAFPLFMLSQALGNIFATGGSSYISRMLGAKEGEEARHTAVVSLYTAFCVGALLTIFMLAFKTPILRLIGASDATFAFTDDYMSVILLFISIAASSAVMSGLMRSEGETQKAMKLQLIGIVLNIILDPIFILWFRMGTGGAAWATVIGQSASFCYGVRYFLSKKTILSIKPADYRPNRKMIGQILSIGVPAGVGNIIMSVSGILGNRISATYGDYVVAGNGVQMRVNSLFFMMFFALAMGFQPFAGYNYGAKAFDRLRKGFQITLIFTTGLCIVGSIVLHLFGASFIRFFIDDAQTIAAGTAFMRVFVRGMPFIGAQITLMVTFQAIGKPVQAMIITMGRQLLIYIPLLYGLNYLFGFNGFIWAQPAADILTTGIAAMLGLSLIRIMRGEQDQQAGLLQTNKE